MERVYYVVPGSDKDDDVANSCDSRSDDAIKKCPSQKSDTVSFRLLRAHRSDKRRQRAKDRRQTSPVPPPPPQICSDATSTQPLADLPAANSHDVGPEDVLEKQKAEVEDYVPSRAEVCLSFCKRFVAFLLSTLGLTMLTILYSIVGGLIFSAIELPHEERVNSGVKDSLDWHVSELWQITAQLNVLHPVTQFLQWWHYHEGLSTVLEPGLRVTGRRVTGSMTLAGSCRVRSSHGSVWQTRCLIRFLQFLHALYCCFWGENTPPSNLWDCSINQSINQSQFL